MNGLIYQLRDRQFLPRDKVQKRHRVVGIAVGSTIGILFAFGASAPAAVKSDFCGVARVKVWEARARFPVE
jgi:hypothetical protein